MPEGTHYAIIVYTTDKVYIEGDERSRTNPGHGYPAHTASYDTFQHFVSSSEKEWNDKIIKLLNEDRNRKDFVAFVVSKVAKVEIEVVVKVKK